MDSPPPTSPTAGNPLPSNPSSVRWRALLLAFALCMLICALTPLNNVYRQATPLGGGHFPLAPFFILTWLTLLVAAVRKFAGHRILLSGRELMLIWVFMVLVSGIAYTGLMRTFLINLTAPFHFATIENRWAERLIPLLPDSWYPRSREAIELLYDGLSGGRQMSWAQVITKIPWDVWMGPLLLWGVFILVCYMVMICMINLLSHQGLENERINFPLLAVPQMMEDALDRGELGNFLTNRFMLAGLMVPVCLHLINGLNFYFPEIPQIPTLVLAGHYFPKHGLFSGFAKLKIYIYPAFIGFAFLAAKQISLSFWLFFLLGGLIIGLLNVLGLNIPAAALGVTFGPTLSRPEETQMLGAYGIFFLFLVWLARHHLYGVVRQAVGLDRQKNSSSEWISTRLSFWGFAIGASAICLFLNYFGIPLWFSVIVTASFFMIMLVASRIICQGGVAYFTLTAAPMDGLLAFFGPRPFTSAGILVTAVVQKMLFLDLRESLMPSLLHASKVSHGLSNRRRIVFAIMITLAAAVVVSFVAMLALCYKFGLRELQLDWATRTTLALYENVNTLVEAPIRPGNWVMIFTFIGACIMLVLALCYHRFFWWPLHPIGYLTAYSSAMRILWVSFFIGWLGNTLCMRYGGVLLFKRLRLFFIGLIIGDLIMGGGWALVGLFSDSSYQVLPT